VLHPGNAVGVIRYRRGFAESLEERLIVTFATRGDVGGYLFLFAAFDVCFTEIAAIGKKGDGAEGTVKLIV